MTSQQILKADLLDLLFENRNKEYGAYVLRRDYPSHLKKAMGFMLLLVTALCLYVWSQPKKMIYVQRTIDLMPDPTITKLKDEKKTEQTKPQERKVEKAPPTQIKTNPVIVPDDKFKNQMAVVNDTADITPGPINSPGTGGEGYVSGKEDPKTQITTVIEPTQPAEPEIYDQSALHEMPQFPGGESAWLSYLQRMLRVPDELEAGDHKTIRVKFVVNSDGEVKGAEIIQSGGNVFDNEVLRVINKMPKWKPGKIRGKPVPVYFTQPVTFLGESTE